MINMVEIEAKTYTFEEMSKILKNAGVKPNSYKQVRVIIELQPNGWLYGITGFSKSGRYVNCLVRGFNTEMGTQYLDELCNYPLKVKVLEKPVDTNDLYAQWF